MKSFKDQLRSIRSALRELGRRKQRVDEPSRINIGSTPASLARDQAASRRQPAPQPAELVVRAATTDEQSMCRKFPSPQPFKPRIGDGCVLNMPEWSGIGRSLQHPDHRSGKPAPMSTRIGIDFGTAFTKAAIRAGVDLVPIEWSAVTGDFSEAGRNVIPGLVVRAPDGEFCWRRLTKADIRGNLKLPVVEMAETEECPVATVAFLALVIRYARAFLYRDAEIGRKLVGRTLRWELNIGCPTKPHENPEVVQRFQRIARTAWQLASRERIYESDIIAAWKSTEADVGLETAPCVIPEFFAQIAGYLGSPQVKDGLHALIDIGAATLDVATFNIVTHIDQESPPRIPIFFSAVDPLGTHYLRQNRHSRLDLDLSWNDAAPVESFDEFAERHGRLSQHVAKIDDEFVEKVTDCIFHIIDTTRTNRRGDPKSPAWQDGLPIFITGGGSSCILYREAITRVEGKLKEVVKKRLGTSKNFRFIELNPNIGKAEHLEPASRLTVALGLTEDAEAIARVVPHHEIEPITYGTKKRVDHTELYSR